MPPWIIKDPISEETRARFSEIHPTILQLLFNRGINTAEEIQKFLAPDWQRDVHLPELFSQMRAAVERIFLAIERKEMITVHGDYDADGVCGSVVLLSILQELQAVNSIFLPHRERDGYGVSVKTVERLKDHEGAKLLITVDCGMSSIEAIARAKQLGMDVIVCDHHQMRSDLPDAILLHPLVPGETYPNKKLCGTGVAFKLASALVEEARRRGKNIQEGYEKWLLDLVAIATVTDVMPLMGENRALEKFGLLVLNKTRRLGLQKLIEAAGIQGKELDTWSIGFQIGPRINAAGRMDHANAAFELLMCQDEGKAEQMAGGLQATNRERQKVSDRVFEEAKAQIFLEAEKVKDSVCVRFARKADWPVGVVGLVAGKLVSELKAPAFVFASSGEACWIGSGRSACGFNLAEAVGEASHVIVKGGGHPEACGVTIAGEGNFRAFQTILQACATRFFEGKSLHPGLLLDAEIHFSLLNFAFFAELEQLKPFGEGNPKPLFCTRGCVLCSIRQVGKDGVHVKCVLEESGRQIPAIGFRLWNQVEKCAVGDFLDVVYEVEMNEWNGRKEIQLNLKTVSL
jgi:single-stranded-DNA-specific exonuclease